MRKRYVEATVHLGAGRYDTIAIRWPLFTRRPRMEDLNGVQWIDTYPVYLTDAEAGIEKRPRAPEGRRNRGRA